MKQTLSRPCKDCPFREDRPFPLHPERVHEIWLTLRMGLSFPCHKTVDYDDEVNKGYENQAQCAGAEILLAKEGEPETQVRQISRRLGLPVTDVDMESPVYESLKQMLAGCAFANGDGHGNRD